MGITWGAAGSRSSYALAKLRGYPAWVVRHHRIIAVLGFVLAIAGGWLARTLPLLTDFAWLLPDSQPSVVALRKLTARKPGSAVIEIGVASPSPDATRRFAQDLAAALREELPPDVLSEVDDDDGELRRFVWDHRHLYASRADLQAALDALDARLAKAVGNDLDLDDDADTTSKNKRVDELRDRLAEAREKMDRPPGYVGEEGRLRMLVLRCRFGDTEPEKGFETLRHVASIVAGLGPSKYDAALEVGYAGDPVSGAQEHDLILHDVVLSTVLCLLLVASVLMVFFRSFRGVVALTVTLLMACAITFGFTRLWIGHLNTSTAFLGSVVGGNGINFGIILLARYFEERRRRGASHEDAIATAMATTVVPTLVAAAAAGAAYLSLTITTFRGFSEFGVIAGSGMIFCWIASFLLLPALLTLFERWKALVGPAALRSASDATYTVRRPGLVGVLAVGVVLLATVLAVLGARRLQANPFEDDLHALRSRSYPSSPAGRWSKRLDAAFGRDQSGGFYVGVERAEDVAVVVQRVRDVEKDQPKEEKQFGKIDALSEVLPGDAAEQAEKIRLLGEIRSLCDRLSKRIDPDSKDGKLLADLRPPPEADLHPIGFDDLPARVRRTLTENDGRHGLLLAIHPGAGFDGSTYRGLARAVVPLRSIELPAGAVASGSEVIFVEMMAAVVHEGPRASLLSLGLVLLLLLLSFGLRAGFALTCAALFVGVFGMFGLMSLFGVRLNFLNYIAVPITIGIGVDYPFNMVARLRREGWRATPGVVQTASAVALCSSTTAIGYSVLLLSDNGAIRSFGAAAALGELTCISAALVVVPALVLVARSFGGARPETGP
jgi:predicted RND superfamily exporter protein